MPWVWFPPLGSDPGPPQGSRALGDGCGGQGVESQPGWPLASLSSRGQEQDSHQRLTQGALGWPNFTDEETDSEGNARGGAEIN